LKFQERHCSNKDFLVGEDPEFSGMKNIEIAGKTPCGCSNLAFLLSDTRTLYPLRPKACMREENHMNEMAVLTEEFRKLVGVESEPEVWEVEKGHIRRHAEAIGDPNPLWRDETFARKTRYGGIIAPPLHLIDVGLVSLVDRLVDMAPDKANINGGTELDFYRPMKAGDTITTVARLADVKEKTGKSGSMIILLIEVTYTNQRGELVARCRNTFIRR